MGEVMALRRAQCVCFLLFGVCLFWVCVGLSLFSLCYTLLFIFLFGLFGFLGVFGALLFLLVFFPSPSHMFFISLGFGYCDGQGAMGAPRCINVSGFGYGGVYGLGLCLGHGNV